MTMVSVDSIVVGNRYRHELGDLEALAESIRTVGLLHPIVVNSRNELVAGQRRLEAMRWLGRTEIAITVVETLDDAVLALTAERDENTQRLAMNFSEMLPLKVALEELERPKAKERSRVHGDTAPGRVNTRSNLEPVSGKTRNVVAKALGKSASTMDKVAEVHRIADQPTTPDLVRKVAVQAIDEMDRTGKVEPNYQAVKAAERAEAVNRYLGNDPDINRLKLQATAFRLMAQYGNGLLALDIEHLAEACDEASWEALEQLAEQSSTWFTNLLARRQQGLRVMTGGRQ